MSSWLKYIEHIQPVKSGYFKAGDSLFYNGIDSRMITPEILRLINEKASIFHKKIKIFNEESVDDFVGYLTGCELCTTDWDVSGYFDSYNNTIAYTEQYCTASKQFLETLCHEMSHSFQINIGIDILDKTLLNRFKSEQQCDTMAYYLMKAINPTLTNYTFDGSYFDKSALNWLADYYVGTPVKNDVF